MICPKSWVNNEWNRMKPRLSVLEFLSFLSSTLRCCFTLCISCRHISKCTHHLFTQKTVENASISVSSVRLHGLAAPSLCEDGRLVNHLCAWFPRLQSEDMDSINTVELLWRLNKVLGKFLNLSVPQFPHN